MARALQLRKHTRPVFEDRDVYAEIAMFTLTVTDHMRLDSEHVARNYTVHAQAAQRLAHAAFSARIALVALLVVAAAASVADLVFQARADRIVAVAATLLALFGFVFYIAVGFEGRVLAHRSLSQRLWLVSERYRSLLAEIEDGMVEGQALLRRRDDLINELHAAYDDRFSADQPGYENDRLATLASDRPSTAPSSSMLSQH
jgi:hypothetical protein